MVEQILDEIHIYLKSIPVKALRTSRWNLHQIHFMTKILEIRRCQSYEETIVRTQKSWNLKTPNFNINLNLKIKTLIYFQLLRSITEKFSNQNNEVVHNPVIIYQTKSKSFNEVFHDQQKKIVRFEIYLTRSRGGPAGCRGGHAGRKGGRAWRGWRSRTSSLARRATNFSLVGQA